MIRNQSLYLSVDLNDDPMDGDAMGKDLRRLCKGGRIQLETHSRSMESAYLDRQRRRERAWEREQDGCVRVGHGLCLVGEFVAAEKLEGRTIVNHLDYLYSPSMSHSRVTHD